MRKRITHIAIVEKGVSEMLANKKMTVKFLIFFAIIFMAMQENVDQVKAATISNSISYTLGNEQSGVLAKDGNEKQYYKFTVSSSGKIQITGSAYTEWVYLYMYDENANEIWQANPHWNSTSEVIAINESLYLTSGSYYFCVGRNMQNCGNYNFKLMLTPTYETFSETNGGSNNSLATSNMIENNGQSYSAQLAINDEKDFWKFQLALSGKITFNATFYEMNWVSWKLFDENGEELYSSNPRCNSTTKNINVSEEIYLTRGTYYISISLDGGNYGKYDFSLKFLASGETYAEDNGGSNNSIEAASNISIGKKYLGQIALNDHVDFYKFALSSSKKIVMQINSPIEWMCVKLFDARGTEFWSSNLRRSSTTNVISYDQLIELEKGIYYIAIQRDGSYWGNYTLELEYLTQANCPHKEYDYLWHNATYFSKGYRLYRCKTCGHSYKSNYESIKKLGRSYLYNYCLGGKGSLKLRWSTVLNASGYQIRYSRKKSMKNGVVVRTVKGQKKWKKTIKKLSRRKKYYIQVRAYKKSGKKIVYGKWSSKKAIRTK